MTSPSTEQNRDLALPPGVFAYMQDLTKGGIKTNVGPIVVNQTGQQRPVVYDPEEGLFHSTSLDGAVCKCVFAKEGEYVVLHNPAVDEHNHPESAQSSNPTDLTLGQTVNIPGPAQFGLWPEQHADVIPGHILKTNQYLLVRIIDGEKAEGNWSEAVLNVTEEEEADLNIDFITGNLIVIKGTQAKFFIPCTGVEVIPENGEYVRDAITLERLEFCILVDEDGEKRYEIGPAVVLPEPTEVFWENTEGDRKFRAYELSEISGLHIKVIADYEDGDQKYKVGEEIFIKGDKTPIYYPRSEHSIISYGDNEIHYATAIPKGEGRYVMNRLTGEIRTEVGYKMLLCDPRKEVIVRRVLPDRSCRLWFPENKKVLSYNQSLREKTTRDQPYVEDVDMCDAFNTADEVSTSMRRITMAAASAAPDVFKRKTEYTAPRTITLEETKFGAVSVSVWTGFAVMVVSKSGERTPVIGPKTIILDHDQDLEVLHMSTGKPKTTDKLEETAYLRVLNNKVSDIITVETSDHVPVEIKLSYRVNFDGDPKKWFDIENYVKFLCDHVRSMLKGFVRKLPIQEFNKNGVAIIRDIILGLSKEVKEDGKTTSHRAGQVFPENGMKIVEVEVLNTKILNEKIAAELENAQHDAVVSNIELEKKERNLKLMTRTEEISREIDKTKASTATEKNKLFLLQVTEALELAQKKCDSTLSQEQKQLEIEAAHQSVLDVSHESQSARTKAEVVDRLEEEKTRQDLVVNKIRVECDAEVKRFESAKEGLVQALTILGDKEAAIKVAEALNPMNLIGGGNFSELIEKFIPGLSETIRTVTSAKPGNNNRIAKIKTEIE